MWIAISDGGEEAGGGVAHMEILEREDVAWQLAG